LNTKEDILKKMSVGPIDLVGYGRKQNTREVNGYQLFDVWSRVCSAEERKALQVWNNLRMSK